MAGAAPESQQAADRHHLLREQRGVHRPGRVRALRRVRSRGIADHAERAAGLEPCEVRPQPRPPLDAIGLLHKLESRNATSPFEKNTFIRSDAVTGFAAAYSQDRFVWFVTRVRLVLLALENALPNEHAPRFWSEHPGAFGRSTSFSAR